MDIYEPGRGFSLDTESAGALILDLSASRSVRNKISVVYMPPSLWCPVTAAQTDQGGVHSSTRRRLAEKPSPQGGHILQCSRRLWSRMLVAQRRMSALVSRGARRTMGWGGAPESRARPAPRLRSLSWQLLTGFWNC